MKFKKILPLVFIVIIAFALTSLGNRVVCKQKKGGPVQCCDQREFGGSSICCPGQNNSCQMETLNTGNCYCDEHCERARDCCPDFKLVKVLCGFERVNATSCAAYRNRSERVDGKYILRHGQSVFSAYCDMTSDGKGWTLAARFSNADDKNWMQDNGTWWYDSRTAIGNTTDPSSNMDMISMSFWLVNGTEFKITRSDDPQHTPLLQTTGNCLSGQTFRSKITSFGDFRNVAWGSDECKGQCTVLYGGQYQSTLGFEQATCNGLLQKANHVGFLCGWKSGDGAVMMIGGGGDRCLRADHGIGITEADNATFATGSIYDVNLEHDFGNEASDYPLTSGYSLNLWIV